MIVAIFCGIFAVAFPGAAMFITAAVVGIWIISAVIREVSPVIREHKWSIVIIIAAAAIGYYIGSHGIAPNGHTMEIHGAIAAVIFIFIPNMSKASGEWFVSEVRRMTSK